MNTKLKTFFKYFLIIMLIAIAIGFSFFIYCIIRINYFKTTIDFDKEKLLSIYNYPKFYDTNNVEITTLAKSKAPINIDSLPAYVKESFISIEDKTFYKHKGINALRIVKAGSQNILTGKAKQGGSTISQQLVKNVFLTNEKTLDRKLKEYALTKKLEKNFNKNEILEMYLNNIYFGRGNFGIENAAKSYFKKSSKDLTIAESATLAGMINSPSFYAKDDNIDKLNARKDLVVSQMYKDGKIDESCKNAQISTKIELLKREKRNVSLETALNLQVQTLLKISDEELENSGIKVFTGINSSTQSIVRDAILNNQIKNSNFNYGSIVLDNSTGLVQAFYSTDNNFAMAKRQVGSAIKPLIVYAPAVETGIISPLTPILDEPINYDGYSPTNSGKSYSGYVSAQNALSKSLNIPAVKILDYVGIEKAKMFAEKMGLNLSKQDNNLALALGSSLNGESLINLTSAYQTLANGGKNIMANFIREITDKNGNVLYKNNFKETNVFGEDTAFLVTQMLAETAKSGTAKKLADLNFSVASKTGTVGVKNSAKNSDAYNFSYTTKNVVSGYVGSIDNKEENLMPQNINGATTPTIIVGDVLKKLSKDIIPEPFAVSFEVEKIDIDALELEENKKIMKASEFTPPQYVISEYFSKRHLPTETSQNFIQLKTPEMTAKIVDDLAIEIKFNVKDYLTYDIYKNDVLLKTISGKSGLYIEYDNDIIDGNTYAYHIISKIKNEKLNEEIVSAPSVSKEIYFKRATIEINEELLNKERENLETIFKEKEPEKLETDKKAPIAEEQNKKDKFDIAGFFSRLFKI